MTWALFAHEENGRYCHVGSKRFVEFHGLKLPIVPVQVSILAEGQGEKLAYYGWQDADEYDKPPSMIWPHWTLFSVCFPYGPEDEVKRGKGRIVQLSIVAG
jgi:hypothetical protein